MAARAKASITYYRGEPLSSVNHVTYHLTPHGLKLIHGPMRLLGFNEVKPDDPFEHGYDVRWFYRSGNPLIHFVATPDDHKKHDRLELGHFCCVVPRVCYDKARASAWCIRDSGSGRIWLQHDAVRIEVRPHR